MTKHNDSAPEEKPLGARERMLASMTPEQLEALSPEERAGLGLPAKETSELAKARQLLDAASPEIDSQALQALEDAEVFGRGSMSTAGVVKPPKGKRS